MGGARRNFTASELCFNRKSNGAADALSRDDLARFRRLKPQAAQWPAVIPSWLPAYFEDPVGNAHVISGSSL